MSGSNTVAVGAMIVAVIVDLASQYEYNLLLANDCCQQKQQQKEW